MYIQEEVNETRKKVIATECNICKKRLYELDPEGWHNFNSHHQSWGADSIDSYKSYDVCSVSCFAKQLELCINYLNGERDAEVSDMEVKFAIELLKILKLGLSK